MAGRPSLSVDDPSVCPSDAARCRRAQKAAAGAAEAAIHRLTNEVQRLKKMYNNLTVVLDEHPEVAQRLALAAPALALSLGVKGLDLDHDDVLKRNVGLHAQDVPDTSAPTSSWRRASKGPRLPHPRTQLSSHREVSHSSRLQGKCGIRASSTATVTSLKVDGKWTWNPDAPEYVPPVSSHSERLYQGADPATTAREVLHSTIVYPLPMYGPVFVSPWRWVFMPVPLVHPAR